MNNMIRKKCEECNGKIIHKKIDYMLLGENLGKFPAEVCTSCEEIVFDENISEQIDEVAKKRGLWGMQARARIGKVGNSFNVIINSKIAKFLELKKGEEVTIYPENRKKLVITV